MLGTLAEGMHGDRIAVDRGQAELAGAVDGVREHAAEDAEPPVRRVDDCRASLGGLRIAAGHDRMVADHAPVVDGDGRMEPAVLQLGGKEARPIEVRVHVAEVVVLIQEPSDALGVFHAGLSNVDGVAEVAGSRVGDALVLRQRQIGVRLGGGGPNMRRQPLAVAAEVDQAQVLAVCQRCQRRRERRTRATRGGKRQPPVVHVDGRDPGARLQRHLELAPRVGPIRVIEGKADERLDDRPEAPGVRVGNPRRRSEGRNDSGHQCRCAGVTPDSDLHAGHASPTLRHHRVRFRRHSASHRRLSQRSSYDRLCGNQAGAQPPPPTCWVTSLSDDTWRLGPCRLVGTIGDLV